MPKQYPKATVIEEVSNNVNEVYLHRHRLLTEDRIRELYPEIRMGGDLKGVGFFLPTATCDWVLVKDGTNNLVLVPLRHEE